MSLIVLYIELAEKNVGKELGVNNDGQVFEHSFKPPKNYQPKIQLSGVPKTCTKLIEKVAHWTIPVSTPCWLNCNNTEQSTLQKEWKGVFCEHVTG